jgi:hypothetical protein
MAQPCWSSPSATAGLLLLPLQVLQKHVSSLSSLTTFREFLAGRSMFLDPLCRLHPVTLKSSTDQFNLQVSFFFSVSFSSFLSRLCSLARHVSFLISRSSQVLLQIFVYGVFQCSGLQLAFLLHRILLVKHEILESVSFSPYIFFSSFRGVSFVLICKVGCDLLLFIFVVLTERIKLLKPTILTSDWPLQAH